VSNPYIPERIVAEISRNWDNSENSHTKPLLCNQFEKVIANNRERGYALESWQMQSVLITDSGEMNETIIAVFVKK
jgi:hypothetical protein